MESFDILVEHVKCARCRVLRKKYVLIDTCKHSFCEVCCNEMFEISDVNKCPKCNKKFRLESVSPNGAVSELGKRCQALRGALDYVKYKQVELKFKRAQKKAQLEAQKKAQLEAQKKVQLEAQKKAQLEAQKKA